MPLFKSCKSECLEWKLWKIEESVEDLLAFNPDNAIFIEEVPNVQRQKEILCKHLLLSSFFEQKIALKYDDNGKPYILDSEYNISISHTKKFVVVARSTHKVGVDVEHFRPQLEKVKHKFCSPFEMDYLEDSNRLLALAMIWSAKETVYKLVGKEVVVFNQQMQVKPFSLEDEALEVELNNKRRLKVDYLILEDAVLTFCCDKE